MFYQVMLTESTVIEKSDRKLDIPAAADDNNESEKITLVNQLSGMPSFTKATLVKLRFSE